MKTKICLLIAMLLMIVESPTIAFIIIQGSLIIGFLLLAILFQNNGKVR